MDLSESKIINLLHAWMIGKAIVVLDCLLG